MANQMTIMWAATVNYMGSQYPKELSPPEVDSAAEPMEEDSDDSSHDLEALITKRPLRQSNLTAFTTTVKEGKSKRLKTAKVPAVAALPNPNQASNQPDAPGEPGEDAAKKQGWTTVEARETQIGNIKQRHYERFEMRLKIPKGSRTPVRDFQARFAQWWEEAKEMDKSLVIRPWYKKNKKKGCISTTEGVPTQWKDLRVYLGKANPSSRSEDVYMQILLASNVDMQVFTSRSNKMEGSYTEGEYAYIQDLRDAEHITEIGFMAYSGNFTKAKQTLKVINQLLAESRAKIKVGGRVKFIGKVQEDVQDEHRANRGSWYNAPWMALHIHADVKDARRASKMLGQIFNKKDAHRGGLNYRYVPKPGTSVMGAKTATKVKAMIKKHQRYMRQLKYEQLKGDFSLDEKDPETKQITLRQFLAKQTKEGCPLIHDVSTTHMADGKEDAIHIVAFGERFPEAVGIIHTIAVRCATEINASTNTWFSDDIVEMSCLMQKDDSGDYVDAEMELEMDFLLDEGFGEVQIDGMGMMDDDQESSPRRKKPRLEDESVYTFTTELGKSAASSRYTQPDSQTEAEEIENKLEAVMREARKDQEAERNRKRVQEQSNEIASKDSIIAALRAQIQASGLAPPTQAKKGAPPMNNAQLGAGEALSTTPASQMDATPEGTRQDGQNLQDKHWGDSTATKGHSILRIAALNVGCLQSESNHWKNRDMWQWILQMKIDVTLLSEIGINWSKMGGTTSWNAEAKQHMHTKRHALSYNEHEQYGSRRQWGDTACTMTGHSSGRVTAQETDPKRLGRWASLTMRGKQGTTVRMVSVYVPSKGGKSAGTVYNQQASWLESQGNNTPPIKQLIQDLEEALQEWKRAGETIVIGSDINMPVDRSQMAEMRRCQGMKEAILSRHPNAPGMSTNIRAQSDRVIDGIWVSESLNIVRAGYSAFGPWDHRTAWVEVTSESIFGTQRKPTPTFSGRRVQLNRPNTVTRYQEQLRKQYRAKQIGQRVQNLRQATEAGVRLTEEQVAEAESIDADRAHMMLNAEKRARRIFLGNVPFSPEIKRKAMEKQFWDLAWKKRQGKNVSSRWYNRAKKKANLSIRTATLSTEEIQERRKRAHQLWKNAKRNAAEYRKTFLEERAKEVARAGKITVAAALSNIVKREEVVQTFQAIRRVTGSYDANGKVAMVIATNESGEEEVFDTEQAVIKQCMKANEAKHRQAYKTPLQERRFEQDVRQQGAAQARQRHQHKFGPYDDMLMDQLLSGHPVPWTAEFLRITVESHQALWSKARERTTSGPSGLHFGLWKANTKDDHLAEVDAVMREISLRTGYNLQRWLRCEDVTLLKEPGNYRVTRFRTISLVEGDFNANLKWVGKIMMRHAEQHDMLPEEQYGSRKQRSVAEVSLNNRMIDDIVRITGTTSAICSNDAKSCYDRMAHNPLRMSMSRIGVPSWISHSVTDAVEKMKHHVLTSFGRSLRTYPTKGTKLQGLLQGLGISPAGWVAMSSPLMQAMQRQGYGFRATSPISRTTTWLVCFSFVDDTDLIHSVRSDASDPNACVAEVQAVVDSWEGMLRATGGALEPRKSYWYLMAFSWDGERWRYKTVEEQPGEISIRQPDSNNKSQLQRLHVDQARKALGVMVRHDGNQESNEAYYTGKAQQWADKMRRGKLLRMHAWIAMKATIWKTIEYPLLSSTFSKAAAERIMRPILQAALPASGIQRNVSRALVFGAPQGLGLGVPHLYNTQTV